MPNLCYTLKTTFSFLSDTIKEAFYQNLLLSNRQFLLQRFGHFRWRWSWEAENNLKNNTVGLPLEAVIKISLDLP